MKKLTTQEFIEKARKIHGDKYDYSKVDYKDARTSVIVICPEHEEFFRHLITTLIRSVVVLIVLEIKNRLLKNL